MQTIGDSTMTAPPSQKPSAKQIAEILKANPQWETVNLFISVNRHTLADAITALEAPDTRMKEAVEEVKALPIEWLPETETKERAWVKRDSVLKLLESKLTDPAGGKSG